ncbi:MAG: EamA family transporter [Clostridia bacterium]|nr:EamA family transporter [Clostridia bacterium]
MKKLSILYIVLAGLFWGTSGIFFSFLKPWGFTPVQVTAIRGTVSAVAMCLYALIRDRSLFRATKKELLIFICSGLCVFGTASLYYSAISASTVSTAVVLMYTAPVFVLIYSVIFLGERLNGKKLFAIAAMIVGCALVSGLFGGAEASAFGILLGLGSGIVYSGYNIFTKIEMLHRSNAVSATLYSFLAMAVAALVVSNPVEMGKIVLGNPSVIVPMMIACGICTGVIPYFLYTLSLRDIPAGTATALGIFEPMFATLFSVLFLNETLSIPSFSGILLILGAAFLLGKSKD